MQKIVTKALRVSALEIFYYSLQFILGKIITKFQEIFCEARMVFEIKLNNKLCQG